MNDIKLDLIRKLTEDLYYKEEDLKHLFSTETILYSIRVSRIERILYDIAIIKLKIETVEKYITHVKDE